MKLLSSLIAILTLFESLLANVEFDISSVDIEFQQPVKNFLPQCSGVDVDFFMQISTSNYSSQVSYSLLQQDASSYNVVFNNMTTFVIPSATDFVAITCLLSMKCSTSQYPYADSFLIFSQTKTQADLNNVKTGIEAVSNVNKWTLTTNVYRKCDTDNQFGFNCNEKCNAINDQNYCYTCGTNGQKLCCADGDVNQNDCSYYGRSTTSAPCTDTSDTYYENLYFWFMIGFVIFSAILLIILLCLLIWLCCSGGVRNKEREEEVQSRNEDEWSEPVEPRANKLLYDADINRSYTRRDRNVQQRSYKKNTGPYFVNREGLENYNYEDDSLASEWIEPQPRREARV